MSNPDKLHIIYQPAKRHVDFEIYEGTTIIKKQYEKLTKYSIGKKDSFVLNLCGDDFFDDILYPFSGKDNVKISLRTTRLDYEDFTQQVAEYNGKHPNKINLLPLDPNDELPDMVATFNLIKEQGEKIISLLDLHWNYIQNISCTSNNTKKYMNTIAEKLEQEKLKIKKSLTALTEDNNVNLCLVGVHSSGKSTLINTLLGYDILPVNIKPETAKILKIKGVPDLDSIYIKFSKIENELETSCKIIWDQVNQILRIKDSNLPANTHSQLVDELKRNGDHKFDQQIRCLLDYLNQDETISIKIDLGFPIPFDSPDLKFTLYDTPGTDRNIDSHQQVLDEALNQTNSILLFVLLPDSLSGTGNVTLMRLLLKKATNYQNSIDVEQSFFIFNKSDSLQKRSDFEVLKRGELKIGGENTEKIALAERKVFFISAQNGFAAMAKKNNISNEDLDYILEYDCIKSLHPKNGCYYQHNHHGKSEYITALNLEKANRALENESDELNKYLIASGIYNLTESIKDFGLRYASTVKTTAIVRSIENAANCISIMVEETKLGTDEQVQDIHQQLAAEISKVHKIIDTTSCKYETKKNSDDGERNRILKQTGVDAENFMQSVIETTEKTIKQRLKKIFNLKLAPIPVIINDDTEILIQSDIEHIYRKYVEQYKEKRAAFLLSEQENFINDFMDSVEKSEISKETKERLKAFKLPIIPEFLVEEYLLELFSTANCFKYGFLKNVCRKIADLSSDAFAKLENNIEQDKKKNESIEETPPSSGEENKLHVREKIKIGLKNAHQAVKEATLQLVEKIDVNNQNIVEKVNTFETRTLNKENFIREVKDWMQKRQASITEKFWEDISEATNQMCSELSQEFKDNLDMYSTRIKALKEEHAPLKTLSVNISQLYDGIVDVQDRLNNTNRGENK